MSIQKLIKLFSILRDPVFICTLSERQRGKTRTIDVRPLDEALTGGDIYSPAILKLDVQGYELEALRGSESLIDHFRYLYYECLLVELCKGRALADEIIAFLRKRGSALNGVYNMAYDKRGMAVQADFLFTKART